MPGPAPEKRGSFHYGSSQVNLVADNTEPDTLAATGYDDDGVACQKWDIVREGVFVGYCTNREVASKIGEARSKVRTGPIAGGACRSCGLPTSVWSPARLRSKTCSPT